MSSVADILQQLAATVGRAQLQRGEIYGNLVAGAAAAPARAIADREQRARVLHEQARGDAQLAIAQHGDTRAESDQAAQERERAVALKDREDWKQISAAMYVPGAPEVDYDAGVARANALGAADKIPTILQHQRDNAPKVGEAAEGTAGRYLTGPKAGQLVPNSQVPKMRPGYTINGQRFDGDGNKIGGLVPPQTPARAVQSEGFQFDGMNVKGVFDPNAHDRTGGYFYNGQDVTDRARVVPPAAPQSGMNTLYGDVNPKAIAQAIRAGLEPPDLEKYGRVASAAIASALLEPDPVTGKQFDRYGAMKQYAAIKRATASLNGNNQVRYDEAIRSGLAMYDKVDELAKQWDGLGIGVLSRVNLAAARDGLKGKAAATLANQLTGQIGQLTSDVATLEQGGLTPTNESRQIAEKSLQDWWGKGTILDMTAQGRYNMQVRHRARAEYEPMVPGDPRNLAPARPATPPGGAAVGTYPGAPGEAVEAVNARAAAALQAAGRASDPASIALFLKNNPTFK